MAVHAQSLVSTLVTKFPYTEEVFAWHDVPLDETHLKMSLYALCWVRGIEVGALIDELEQVIASEEDHTEELSPDEWTDEQRAARPVPDDEDDAGEWGADFLTSDAPDLEFESAAG